MRAVLVAIVVITLVGLGCRSQDDVPRSARAPEHTGTTPAHSMAKPYQELTPAQMIEIAQRFHPRLNPANYQGDLDFRQAYEKTPQRHALKQAQAQAWANRSAFHSLLASIQEALPPGSDCIDQTPPGHDIAYYAMIRPPHDAVRGATLILHVSFIIPYYAYYEIADDRTLDDIARPRQLYKIRPELRPVANVVEGEITRRWGYYRFPAELMKTRLSELYVENSNETEPLLFEAIMGGMI